MPGGRRPRVLYHKQGSLLCTTSRWSICSEFGQSSGCAGLGGTAAGCVLAPGPLAPADDWLRLGRGGGARQLQLVVHSLLAMGLLLLLAAAAAACLDLQLLLLGCQHHAHLPPLHHGLLLH